MRLLEVLGLKPHSNTLQGSVNIIKGMSTHTKINSSHRNNQKNLLPAYYLANQKFFWPINRSHVEHDQFLNNFNYPRSIPFNDKSQHAIVQNYTLLRFHYGKYSLHAQLVNNSYLYWLVLLLASFSGFFTLALADKGEIQLDKEREYVDVLHRAFLELSNDDFDKACSIIKNYLNQEPDFKRFFKNILEKYISKLVKDTKISKQECFLIKAFLFYAGNFREEAETNIKFALEASVNDPERAQAAYFLQANILADNNEYEAEIECYNKILKINPVNVSAYCDMAIALSQLDRDNEALKNLDKAIYLDCQFANAFYQKSLIYYKKGQYKEAVDLLDKAIAIDKFYRDAYANKGVILASVYRNYPEAQKCLKEVLKIDPNNAKAYHNLGAISIRRGELGEALILFSKAVGLERLFIEARYSKAVTLKRLGMIDKAKGEFEALAHLVEELGETLLISPRIYQIFSYALMELQKYDSVLKYCDKWLLKYPNDTNALNLKGYIFKKQGSLNEALNCYKNVITINPGDRLAHYNVAYVLSAQGKNADDCASYYLEGLAAYEHKLTLNKKNFHTACFAAAKNGNLHYLDPEISYYNLDLNMKDEGSGETLLSISVKNGRIDNVKYLLDKGAIIAENITEVTAFINYARKSAFNEIANLLEHEFEKYLNSVEYKCFKAITDGQLSTLEKIIGQFGINTINSRGETPLMKAVESGKFDIVKFLVKNGANIGTANPHKGYETALDIAAQGNKIEILAYLIENRLPMTSNQLHELIDPSLEVYRGTRESYEKEREILNQIASSMVCIDINTFGPNELALKARQEQSIFKYLCAIKGISGLANTTKLDFQFNGYRLEYFLPLRIRYLLETLIEAKKNILQGEFPEEREIVISKLKRELLSDIELFYVRKEQRIMGDLAQSLTRADYILLINAHVNSVLKKLKALNENEQFIYPTGFSPSKTWWHEVQKGHQIYVNFIKQNNQIVVRIDNLGDGCPELHDKEDKKNKAGNTSTVWKPYIAAILPLESLQGIEAGLIGYLKDILLANFSPKNLNVIYRPHFFNKKDLKLLPNNPWPAKTLQKVENCVTKGHDIGLQYRFNLKDKKLYSWFKKKEKKSVAVPMPVIKTEIDPHIDLFLESLSKPNLQSKL
jgi:tetratricopeptide (TPR) repeat protein